MKIINFISGRDMGGTNLVTKLQLRNAYSNFKHRVSLKVGAYEHQGFYTLFRSNNNLALEQV